MKEQQQVPIHTEYIQIDQLLKLEGIIETGGQIKSLSMKASLLWMVKLWQKSARSAVLGTWFL